MAIINRRKTSTVYVGDIPLGSKHPIVIQSMTNTPTADIDSTVAQIIELAKTGSELVRITVNDDEAALAVPQIIKLLPEAYKVPIIGDFHYNGHILLEKFPQMAMSLAKYRINPGNVGNISGEKDNFSSIIHFAQKYNKPIRIGVNFGSLDKQLFNRLMDENASLKEPKSDSEVAYKAIVTSAIANADRAIKLGLKKEKIILSAKISNLQDLITVNKELAAVCDFPIHVGLTEAGNSLYGTVASSAAMGYLLQKGIGDTIRVSLTPEPGIPRSREVEVCKALLQSMGLRYFRPQVTSCPGCGRTASIAYQELAQKTNDYIDQNLQDWKQRYPGVESLKIAVMGCVVNGPGESRHADIGISLPGTGEVAKAPVYINGELYKVLKNADISGEFFQILENYLQKTYAKV